MKAIDDPKLLARIPAHLFDCPVNDVSFSTVGVHFKESVALVSQSHKRQRYTLRYAEDTSLTRPVYHT